MPLRGLPHGVESLGGAREGKASPIRGGERYVRVLWTTSLSRA